MLKVSLYVRRNDQSRVSFYSVNLFLGRERRAKSFLHPSEFIFSSFGLSLNSKSKKIKVG